MVKHLHILLTLFAIGLISKSIAQQQNGAAYHRGITEAEIEQASILLPWEDVNKHIKENMFVRVEASKKVCFVGEPVLVTYKLYTRLQSHSKVVDAPTFTGCSVVEMTTNEQKEGEEIVDRKVFRTYIIRKVQLFPLQEGLLQLGKATLDNDIEFFKKGVGGYNRISQKVALVNDSVNIKVNPLPVDSAQQASSVVVGKFFLLAKVAKPIDTANDNNFLELKITGAGNFMNMVCPSIIWPATVVGYEPQSSETLDKLAFPVLGEKKFTIPFTCKKVGEIEIPPITFKYFDGDSEKYVSIHTDSIHVTVKPEIPLINPAKLSTGIVNIRSLWIIPLIASIVGLIFLYYSVRKKNVVLKNNQVVDEGKDPENQIIQFQERLTTLYSINDNKTFFSEAKLLATTLKDSALNKDQGIYEKPLEVIINLCNQALYTPIQPNRETMIMTLQSIIDSKIGEK